MLGRSRLKRDCNVSTSRNHRGRGTPKVKRSLLVGTCAWSVSRPMQEPLAFNLDEDQYYSDAPFLDSDFLAFFVRGEALNPLLKFSSICYEELYLKKIGSMFGYLHTKEGLFDIEKYAKVLFDFCERNIPDVLYTVLHMRREDLCKPGSLFCFLVERGSCLVRECFWHDLHTHYQDYHGSVANLTDIGYKTQPLQDEAWLQFQASCHNYDDHYLMNLSHALGKIQKYSLGEVQCEGGISSSEYLEGVYIFFGVLMAGSLLRFVLPPCGPWLTRLKSWLWSRGEAPIMTPLDTLENGSSHLLTEGGSQVNAQTEVSSSGAENFASESD